MRVAVDSFGLSDVVVASGFLSSDVGTARGFRSVADQYDCKLSTGLVSLGLVTLGLVALGLLLGPGVVDTF